MMPIYEPLAAAGAVAATGATSPAAGATGLELPSSAAAAGGAGGSMSESAGIFSASLIAASIAVISDRPTGPLRVSARVSKGMSALADCCCFASPQAARSSVASRTTAPFLMIRSPDAHGVFGGDNAPAAKKCLAVTEKSALDRAIMLREPHVCARCGLGRAATGCARRT